MVKKIKSNFKFDFFVILLLILVGLICLFPLLYVFSVSLTPMSEVFKNGGFIIIPREITFEAYKSILKQGVMPHSLLVTITVSLVGTIISMCLTILMAYPLSKKNLPGRKLLIPFFIFTMMFNGGTIPTYLLVKELGLTGTYWSLILPGAVSTYNALVMKSFFENMPAELFESAYIDGASERKILLRIVIPLAKPVLLTVGLFYLVSYWNTYFPAIMYISDEKMHPLQVVLKKLLMANNTLQNIEAVLPSTTLQMAAVIFSSIPIVVVYPFIQKHFTKGMMLGAVKG